LVIAKHNKTPKGETMKYKTNKNFYVLQTQKELLNIQLKITDLYLKTDAETFKQLRSILKSLDIVINDLNDFKED